MALILFFLSIPIITALVQGYYPLSMGLPQTPNWSPPLQSLLPIIYYASLVIPSLPNPCLEHFNGISLPVM